MRKITLFTGLMLAISSVALAQWTQLNTGTSQPLYEIFFPATDTGFAVGDSGTIIATVSGGSSWIMQSSGTILQLNDIFFLNSQTGFVVGDSGYFAQTSDAGNNWNSKFITNGNPVDLSSVFFTSALVGYAGGSENWNDGIIFKTIDGGATWSVTNTPISFLNIDYKRIVFPVPDTGYALTRGMCMKTVDAGNNWFITDTAMVNSGAMFSILEDAFFFSPDTGYIVGWYNPFCGYTTNGGITWVDNPVLNNQWYCVDFPSRQIGYMAGWGQLAKTTDGGQTWIDISSPLLSAGVASMHFSDDNTGYACGYGGFVIKTINGGTTSITEIEHPDVLRVFPNPSNGVFEVFMDIQEADSDGRYLEVFNMTGKRVFRTEMPHQKSIIDLSSLAKGVYHLEIHDRVKVHSTRIVIR